MAVRLMGSIRKYLCLSSDTKPTGVPVGSVCRETDTCDVYVTHDGTNWVKYKRNSDANMTAQYLRNPKLNTTFIYKG